MKDGTFLFVVDDGCIWELCLQLVFMAYSHTSGNNQFCIWIERTCMADYMPRLLVALVRDGASIYHNGIGIGFIFGNHIAIVLELNRQCICFELIQPATQSLKSYFH